MKSIRMNRKDSQFMMTEVPIPRFVHFHVDMYNKPFPYFPPSDQTTWYGVLYASLQTGSWGLLSGRSFNAFIRSQGIGIYVLIFNNTFVSPPTPSVRTALHGRPSGGKSHHPEPHRHLRVHAGGHFPGCDCMGDVQFTNASPSRFASLSVWFQLTKRVSFLYFAL